MHRFIIVGGGAGGLELATRLGRPVRFDRFEKDARKRRSR